MIGICAKEMIAGSNCVAIRFFSFRNFVVIHLHLVEVNTVDIGTIGIAPTDVAFDVPQLLKDLLGFTKAHA